MKSVAAVFVWGVLFLFTGCAGTKNGTSPSAGPVQQSKTQTVLYVTNSYQSEALMDTISGFAIDSGTGQLTPLPGSPFPAPSNVLGYFYPPGGKALLVSRADVFEICPGCGPPPPPETGVWSIALGPGGTLGQSQLREPFPNAAMDPSGKFLFASETPSPGSPSLTSVMHVYSIDGSTGGLTENTASSYTFPEFVSGLFQSVTVALVQGNLLWVHSYLLKGNPNDTTGGALTPQQHRLLALTIDPVTGSLAPSSLPPIVFDTFDGFAFGTPNAIFLRENPVDPTNPGQSLPNYLNSFAIGNGTVQFAQTCTGAMLAACADAGTVIEGPPPQPAETDPAGQHYFALVPFWDPSGTTFTSFLFSVPIVHSQLNIAAAKSVNVGIAGAIAISPDGKFVYAGPINTSPGSMAAFSVAPDGTLSAVPGPPLPPGIGSVTTVGFAQVPVGP